MAKEQFILTVIGMKTVFVIIFSIMVTVSAKEVVRVGLEEAKPIISRRRNGIIEKILKEIEKEGEFVFKVDYMTYGRALLELQKDRIDLIGITPTGNETPDFYSYATDLNWSFETYNVLFFLEKNSHRKFLTDFKSIGTPSGNEAFMAKMFNVKKSRFHGGGLSSLFKMLEKDRIEAILFEGISSMTLLRELDFSDIKFRLVNSMRGGLSVSNKKLNLKMRLDKAIQKTNWKKYFTDLSVMSDLKKAEFIKVRPQ